jgi:hypothetical protein
MPQGSGWRCRALLSALVVLVVRGVTAEDLDPALGARLTAVEGAFRGGSASGLRACVSRTAKVRVDLRGQAEGSGSYGASQLQVIFERIFDESPTREFTVKRDEVTVSAQGTAFARARWSRRSRAGGDEVTDTLTLTLRREDGEWRVYELRSSRS